MEHQTRQHFEKFCARVAELNNVSSVTNKFTVEPSVEQKLEDRITESIDFLKQINSVPVKELKGETLGLGVDKPIASRTDTSTKDRTPRDLSSFSAENSYECVKTDYDSYITYKTLDTWAKFGNLQTRIRNHITKRIAQDRLMVGWNGTSVAKNTDPTTNTLLQDVNKGWLQKIRDRAGERYLTGVKIGDADGKTYKNTDAAVFDMVHSLLGVHHRKDTDNRVFISSDMVTNKYLGLIQEHDAPTERIALNTLLSTRTLGGLPAVVVPYFPDRTILITKPSNLSIYWQTGGHRRNIIENPKRDCIEDYQSINEDYVIETFEACALFDGIQCLNDDGDWA